MPYSNSHMNMKSLRKSIHALADDTLVQYDSGLFPGVAHSYRGFYGDISFSPTTTPVTAGEFKEEIYGVWGQMFEGWKGGEFYYNDGSYVWAGEKGETGPYLTGIELVDGVAIIHTMEDED